MFFASSYSLEVLLKQFFTSDFWAEQLSSCLASQDSFASCCSEGICGSRSTPDPGRCDTLDSLASHVESVGVSELRFFQTKSVEGRCICRHWRFRGLGTVGTEFCKTKATQSSRGCAMSKKCNVLWILSAHYELLEPRVQETTALMLAASEVGRSDASWTTTSTDFNRLQAS